MSDDFELIRRFDELEKLTEGGVDPASLADKELAEALEMVGLLRQDAAAMPAMPRTVEFRKQVMGQVAKRRRRMPWPGFLAVAAALVAGFFWMGRPQPADPGDLMIDPSLLARAEKREAEDDMLAYLETTEQLLVAIRDYEVTCSEGDMNVAVEKELARELLLKQKLFTAQTNRPEYYQARHLFQQLETILVDVNSLDPCTDPFEIDFINEHVTQQRILSKLRLVAQDLKIS